MSAESIRIAWWLKNQLGVAISFDVNSTDWTMKNFGNVWYEIGSVVRMEEIQTKLLRKIKVRRDHKLFDGERKYVFERMKVVQSAIQKMISEKAEMKRVPKIGLCVGGEGFRAMIATAGFFKAAESLGLLDSILYVSASSGAMWFLLSWFMSQLSVKDFKEKIVKILETPLQHQISRIEELLFLKGNNIPSVAEMYGMILATRLMNSTEHKLSHLQNQRIFKSYKTPYPIFNTIELNPLVNSDQFSIWVEITPHSLGILEMNAQIPVESIGAVFSNGVTLAPCKSQEMISNLVRVLKTLIHIADGYKWMCCK